MKSLTSCKFIPAAVALCALIALGTAYGQTSNVMRVTVPFEFRAGHGMMPAGDYRVEVDPVSQRLSLLSAGGPALGFLPARAAYGPAGERSKLVFHEYGNVRFLRTVAFGGATAYQLPESGAERETAKLMRPSELALLRK